MTEGAIIAELLKPTDVAARWGVSRSWVYRAAESGELPHLRLGGAGGPLRFEETAIAAYEDRHRCGESR